MDLDFEPPVAVTESQDHKEEDDDWDELPVVQDKKRQRTSH